MSSPFQPRRGRRGWPRRSEGVALCQLLVSAGVIIVLFAVALQGFALVRSQAEITQVSGRAHQLGTALRLYDQDHNMFPDAYPAHLEEDLAPYVPDQTLCLGSGGAESGPEPLNQSYVTPPARESNNYVLSLALRRDPGRAVALFADMTVEVVDQLVVLHEGESRPAGSRVTGGLLRFASGGAVKLCDGTAVTIVQSFRANDGSLFHILKQDRGESGWLAALAADGDIVEFACGPALVQVRGGVAAIDLLPAEQHIRVTTCSGEVVVDGKLVEGGPLVEETQSVAGGVSLGMSNNEDFMFVLEKPDGTTITRQDLLNSGRELEYWGPVKSLRFRGRNGGGGNSLTLNDELFLLEPGQVYTITADDMTAHLYNDKKDQKGKAMGHWRVDDVQATGAHISLGTDGDDGDEGGSESLQAAGDLGFVDELDVVRGDGSRTLSPGAVVRQNYWVEAEKYR